MVFHKNIIELAKQNENFRQVVSTGKHSQIVLMSLLPREDIGEEVHDAVDQILVFVQGNGEAVIESQPSPVKEGDLVFVNAGVKHNFRNTGSTPLKIYTVYSPVNHPADRIQKTKAEAMKEEY
ncbi:MAG: Cupin 2 conserved barrel domain protein [Candidatus Wolfebacteria bacterium GW2011_GWA2_42_10]|uniref:Cupin 2 conserved barrel domain protein n=2 Tax=Candidatus Wolfeibacteriota TaxID=1752735 RepID=A0A0G0ZUD0_9BACT|nr:MAG: Cupin 2 conserved barrel domain protein [Candidatus Wolfebacteria bacterium GW2011_GWB1_41_12]KKS25591.1 MAG: Cupin 2 conserved barrel domain protein [Candidatus Wolfebacteria bacterium GW2011_GWA2_42_10]KKT56518.1 MAG: Cupin 2 conserved barrel domain protein [Candidatus Wolfebacteria bacterium GW2011_GWA1_44_24]